MWLRIALILSLWASLACAASVQWNASVVDAEHGAPDGYRVYYGYAADQLTTTYDVGTALNFPIPETWNPATYYFGVRAYNASGESGWATTPEGQTWVAYTKSDPPPVLPPEPATDVQIVWEPIEEPPIMAEIFSESFEGTGYENTWSETTYGGTVNEDSTGPGSLPSGGGSQCLRVNRTSDSDVYARYDHGSNIAVMYLQLYIYIDNHNLGTDHAFDTIAAIHNDSFNTISPIQIGTSGTQLQLRCGLRGTDYTWYYLDAANISVDQWYCVEVLFDSTNDICTWRLNGTEIDSMSMTPPAALLTPRNLRLGSYYGTDGVTYDIYFDLVVVEDADWVYVGGASAVPKIMLLQDHFSG